MWKFVQQLSSPKYFYHWGGKIIFPLGVMVLILMVTGLVGGLWLAPPDYQQGDAFRIIYIHVPSAVLSLLIYTFMSIFSIIFLVWKIKLADVLAKVSAPLGASFTLIALVT